MRVWKGGKGWEGGGGGNKGWRENEIPFCILAGVFCIQGGVYDVHDFLHIRGDSVYI